MRCAESVRVQAYFDGELDATSVPNLEEHIKQCTECAELLQSLEHTRARVRGELPRFTASAALRTRIQHSLDAEDAPPGARPDRPARRPWRSTTFWWGGLAGAGATVAAGALAFFVLTLPVANPVIDAVLNAHVRSLMSAHLIDVASTDRHTVKPWFAGHAEVSPVVADFASQGYQLTGGRVDDLERQRAAVSVYRHGAHVIDVFCWVAPRAPLPANATRRGYHLIFWRSGDLAYAAVSDTGWDELIGLEHLLRGVDSADPPPADSPPGRE